MEYEDITSTQIDVAFEIIEKRQTRRNWSAPMRDLDDHAVDDPVNQAIAYGPTRSTIIIFESRRLVRDNAGGRVRWLKENLQSPIWLYSLDDAVRGARAPRIALAAANPEVKSLTVHGRLSGPQLTGAKSLAIRCMRWAASSPSPRPFLRGDFVTTDTGTGLVHMSPDHGEDDFLLCKANGIDPVPRRRGRRQISRRLAAGWAARASVINPKFNAPRRPDPAPICAGPAR